MISACSWISETSWFKRVTSSCWRKLSVLKFRISGCEYCSAQLVLNVGLKRVLRLLVVARLLLSVAENPPPPQRKFWFRPPLKLLASRYTPAPALLPPARRLLLGSVWDEWDNVETSVGR